MALTNMHSAKPSARGLVIVGAVVVSVAAYWAVFRCPLPFVAAWWNADSEHGTTLRTRYRVADGLAASGRLKGMTRSEVVSLLGVPTSTDKFRDHGLIYVLGPERGVVQIDYEWLAIDFDSSGVVSRVAVVTD